MTLQTQQLRHTVSSEVNFDGLVGSTHHYAGLSYGNVASQGSAQANSNPKQAALQGLQKMKCLSDLGLVQGVLAPQERPDVQRLRRLGFSGSDAQVLEKPTASTPHYSPPAVLPPACGPLMPPPSPPAPIPWMAECTLRPLTLIINFTAPANMRSPVAS